MNRSLCALLCALLLALCACAAPFCTGPVLLRDAGCTDKSYPGFWADYRRLGGQTEEV